MGTETKHEIPIYNFRTAFSIGLFYSRKSEQVRACMRECARPAAVQAKRRSLVKFL